MKDWLVIYMFVAFVVNSASISLYIEFLSQNDDFDSNMTICLLAFHALSAIWPVWLLILPVSGCFYLLEYLGECRTKNILKVCFKRETGKRYEIVNISNLKDRHIKFMLRNHKSREQFEGSAIEAMEREIAERYLLR